METINRILVAIDFSQHSVAALIQAARLAGAHRATLRAVHVVSPETIEDIQEFRSIPTDRILADTRARLEALVTSKAAEADVECEVIIGHAFDQLVRSASSQNADLLVMGSRGETEASHKVGMIATKCIRRAPSPILLVRGSQLEAFRHVVACIDFSETSGRALEFAADVARRENATLDIVHSFYPPWLHPTSVIYSLTQAVTDEERGVYLRGLQQKVDGFIDRRRGSLEGIRTEVRLLERMNAAYAIVDHLVESGADLVVLGTRGRTGFKALLLGTTAERLVHESPCSVLAVKPPDF